MQTPVTACLAIPKNAASIAAAVRQLTADPAALRHAGELARQRILTEWNYESAFRSVFRLMSGDPEPAVAAQPAPVRVK